MSLNLTRYALARLADPDIQAEAATVMANVTSTIYEAQMQVSISFRGMTRSTRNQSDGRNVGSD